MLVLYQYQDLLGHLKWCRIYFPSTVCLYTGWCLEGRSQGYLKTFENGEHFEATSYPGYNASQLALVDFVAPWDLWKLPNGNWMDRYEGLSLSNCWERSHLPDPFRRHFWSWWFSELLRGYVIINREGISVTCIKLISKIGDAASHLQKKNPGCGHLVWHGDKACRGCLATQDFFMALAPREKHQLRLFSQENMTSTLIPRDGICIWMGSNLLFVDFSPPSSAHKVVLQGNIWWKSTLTSLLRCEWNYLTGSIW